MTAAPKFTPDVARTDHWIAQYAHMKVQRNDLRDALQAVVEAYAVMDQAERVQAMQDVLPQARAALAKVMT